MILPYKISFENWAASLIVDFPTDDIPIYKKEYSWKIWGDGVAQCDSFAMNGCPGTHRFNDPLEWANAVYSVMTNFS